MNNGIFSKQRAILMKTSIRDTALLLTKGIFIVFWILLLISVFGYAKPTSRQDAASAVSAWIGQPGHDFGAGLGKVIKNVAEFKDSAGNNIYYIVSLDPGGFVIISADDLIEPIIGFAAEGRYDPSEANPLGALLSRDMVNRKAKIAKATGANTGGKSLIPSGRELDAKKKWEALLQLSVDSDLIGMGLITIPDKRVPVDSAQGLIMTRWNQSTVAGIAVYNYYTPPYSAGNENNCVCGCTATALAQYLVYRHGLGGFPTSGPAQVLCPIKIDGTSESRLPRGGNGSGGAYDWGNMVDMPSGSITTAQRQAIGALTYDAGLAARSEYQTAGETSGNLDAVSQNLVSVFHYACSRWSFNGRLSIPDAPRNAMINPNLDAGWPVLLGIYHSGPGGHAVVCDGYGYSASTLYHHLNLGWSGASDAWYNLPNVDVSDPYPITGIIVYNVYESGSGEIISGRIVDSGGSPLSGVSVTATKVGGGTYGPVLTNSNGIYAITKVLSASQYTINAQKSGYSFNSLSNISVGTSSNGSTQCGNVWGADFTGTAGNGQTFTIYNDGTGDLNVTSITPDQSAPWISWSPGAPFTIPASGSKIVTVSINYNLAPTGQSSRRLLVNSNDSTNSPYPGGVNIVVDNTLPPAGTVQFKSSTLSVNEAGANITILVSRTGGSSGAASVNFATANGTAVGSDFTPASGTLNWADGDAADKSFTVSIINDNIHEADETFTVSLSGTSGASLGTPNSTTVTIIDDDSGDPYDPLDDTWAHPTLLNPPTSNQQFHTGHSLSSTDQYDWFQIRLTAGVKVNFNSIGGIGDDYIEIISSTGQGRLACDDNSGDSGQFSINFTPLVTGDYWVRVRGARLGNVCSYDLNYNTVTIPPGKDAWDTGDDDWRAPNLLPPPTSTDQTFGQFTLSSTDRYDWFKAKLNAGTRYYFYTTGTGDNYMELMNYSTGACVSYDNNSAGGGQAGLTFTPLVSGQYLLRIRAKTLGNVCAYYLKCRTITPNPGEDAWDPKDNTFVFANLLPDPTTTVRSFGLFTLSPTDRYDWFKVKLTAGVPVRFESVPGTANTYGTLFNYSTGQIVAQDDNDGEGIHFLIDYTPPVTGYYMLRVHEYYARNGSYYLKCWRTTSALSPAGLRTAAEDDWLRYE